jgi:MFS family permease
MAMVGVVILISGISSAVAQLLAGVITDKLGRRPLLMITMSTSILLYAGMAALIGSSAPVPVIAAVYALVRATLSMQRPTIHSVVADLAPKERLTETFGLMIMGGNLGFAAGPALGGFLASSLTYAWLFALGAGIIATAFIIIIFCLKESFRGSTEKVALSSIFSAGKDRNLLAFTGLCLLLFLVTGQLASTLPVYTVSHAGLSTAQYGTLLTLNGLMITVLQYPVTRLMAHLSISVSLITGAFLYAVGYFTLSWVGPYSLALGAVALITTGEIFCTPTIMTVVGRLASQNWRGRYMAFFGMAETLGMTMGPLLGGLLLDIFPENPVYVWGMIALLAVLAAVGFGRFSARLKSA